LDDMGLRVAVLTRRGSGRDTNQDRVIVNHTILAADHPTTSMFTVQPPTLVAVFDGLGGHPAGHIASTLAAEHLASSAGRIRSEPDIISAVDRANRWLYQNMFAYPNLESMGATIAGTFITGDTMVVFHVGDSRVYIHDRERMQRVTVDDWDDGYITQTLGGWDTFHPISVHTSTEPMPPNGRVLVATDGLFGMADHHELAEVIGDCRLEHMPEQLLRFAVESGNTDDCTIAVIEPDG